MRSFITALVLGAVLVAAGFAHSIKLEKTADELKEINGRISSQIESENYNDASKTLSELMDRVNEFEPFFATFGDHDEMDSIEINMSELSGFLEGEQKYDALSRSYALSFLFDHLPKNIRIKIENIF